MAFTSSSRRTTATDTSHARRRVSRTAGVLLATAALFGSAACGADAPTTAMTPNDGDASASAGVAGPQPTNSRDAAAALVLPRSSAPAGTPTQPGEPATVTVTVTPRPTAAQNTPDSVPEDDRVLTQVDVSQHESYWFRTPSKNITCIMSGPGDPGDDATVRCTIVAKDWRSPEKPAECPLDWGNDLEVGNTGQSGFVCAGDTVLGASTIVDYGTRLIMKPGLTCTVTVQGVTCASRFTERGFFLAREKYRLF
ncbi:MAG: hypothetical protein Q4G51_17205 [Dermatophilus congolensis]|nr:hypothetical protein [Dermatophilus congolensis]